MQAETIITKRRKRQNAATLIDERSYFFRKSCVLVSVQLRRRFPSGTFQRRRVEHMGQFGMHVWRLSRAPFQPQEQTRGMPSIYCLMSHTAAKKRGNHLRSRKEKVTHEMWLLRELRRRFSFSFPTNKLWKRTCLGFQDWQKTFDTSLAKSPSRRLWVYDSI